MPPNEIPYSAHDLRLQSRSEGHPSAASNLIRSVLCFFPKVPYLRYSSTNRTDNKEDKKTKKRQKQGNQSIQLLLRLHASSQVASSSPKQSPVLSIDLQPLPCSVHRLCHHRLSLPRLPRLLSNRGPVARLIPTSTDNSGSPVTSSRPYLVSPQSIIG